MHPVARRHVFHRRDAPMQPESSDAAQEDDDRGRGMLVNPAFWIAGLCSAGVWGVILYLVFR